MNRLNSLYIRLGGRTAIAVLVKQFYADVLQHQVIGPIFGERIEDWPEHLEKITDFWSRVTGGPSNYTGQMPMKHLALGLKPDHFDAWLGLWVANCRAYLKPAEADEMIALAREIGLRLKGIVSLHAPS